MPSKSQYVVPLRKEIGLKSALEVCRRVCVAITLVLRWGDDGIGRLDLTPTIVARVFHDAIPPVTSRRRFELDVPRLRSSPPEEHSHLVELFHTVACHFSTSLRGVWSDDLPQASSLRPGRFPIDPRIGVRWGFRLVDRLGRRWAAKCTWRNFA